MQLLIDLGICAAFVLTAVIQRSILKQLKELEGYLRDGRDEGQRT